MKYLAITAILCLVLAGASFAGNVTVTEVITGGNLTLTMPNNFSMSGWTLGGESLTGVDGPTVYYTVEDARGTGAGWNLAVQISQFKTSGTPMHTLATDAFGIFKAAECITKIWGQDVDETNGPKAVGAAFVHIEAGVDCEAYHALSGYGLGKYNFELAPALDITASAYAGTYTATLTATLNNAP